MRGVSRASFVVAAQVSGAVGESRIGMGVCVAVAAGVNFVRVEVVGEKRANGGRIDAKLG